MQPGITILLYMSFFNFKANQEVGTKHKIESPKTPVIKYVILSKIIANVVKSVIEQFVIKI